MQCIGESENIQGADFAGQSRFAMGPGSPGAAIAAVPPCSVGCFFVPGSRPAPSMGSWYQELGAVFFTPPDWLFGGAGLDDPLFAMIVAAWRVARPAPSPARPSCNGAVLSGTRIQRVVEHRLLTLQSRLSGSFVIALFLPDSRHDRRFWPLAGSLHGLWCPMRSGWACCSRSWTSRM